ncbi:uncharacterized protein BP5553_06638 [Venustampulla echinocandica]|uniref:Serine hydrolase domain-containing protein n=1 Tax=Venustampulla echinocandica TaxID=2656787 RepID=A0A370TKH4_9HELO|nr:uncharacterized protein BP5553_06638 [Venustampulla echinocandica]RDL36026.1 hypothetical protein BP5553_06638 [Venustampulla echinocandica]
MATNGVDASSLPTSPPKEEGPRKLKILMLHGYTQSGPLFRSKTRALEKLLQKSFPTSKTSPYPGGVALLYPTAPIHLQPADIPNFSGTSETTDEAKEELDAWGWWTRSSSPSSAAPSSADADVRYDGLSDGLAVIKDTILAAGGVDGVIGFSQGGCAALFVASLLEPSRSASFSAHKPDGVDYPEGWAELFKLQESVTGGALKFAVSYSGFYAPGRRHIPFYEPKIGTPSLHFIGSLDSVVDETLSTGLVDRCVEGKSKVVYHPGGHFVPVGKEMGAVLVGFVRDCCVHKEEKKEESVEDMDVPF